MAGANDPRRREQPGPEEPSLNIGVLLSAGVDGLASVTGVQVVALLSVLSVASAVLFQSLVAVYVEVARGMAVDPEVVETLEGLGPLPLAVDVPLGFVIVGMLVLPLVGEAVKIVAVRAFADGTLDGLSGARIWPNLTKATILGFLGGTLLLVATTLGLALFVAPGLLVAVTMVFFRQEVAVADKGIVDSIKGSWNLTEGHRWDVLGLLFVLLVIGVGLSLTTLVLPAGSVAVPVLGGVLGSVGTVFSVAVVTEAYVTLRGGGSEPEDDVPMGPEEIDEADWNTDDTTQW